MRCPLIYSEVCKPSHLSLFLSIVVDVYLDYYICTVRLVSLLNQVSMFRPGISGSWRTLIAIKLELIPALGAPAAAWPLLSVGRHLSLNNDTHDPLTVGDAIEDSRDYTPAKISAHFNNVYCIMNIPRVFSGPPPIRLSDHWHTNSGYVLRPCQ